MPILDNPRHERFAQYLLKGKSATEAYVMAGYKGDRTAASRLSTNANIKARVAELQASAASRAEKSVADISLQLDEDRALAHKVQQAGAAVSASVAHAKLFGHMKDKVDHSGSVAMKFDLSGLSDEQLAQLETIFGAVAGLADHRRHTGGAET